MLLFENRLLDLFATDIVEFQPFFLEFRGEGDRGSHLARHPAA
jgi:hypothetical protein